MLCIVHCINNRFMTKAEIHPTLHNALARSRQCPRKAQHLSMSSDYYKVHPWGHKQSLIHLPARIFTFEQAHKRMGKHRDNHIPFRHHPSNAHEERAHVKSARTFSGFIKLLIRVQQPLPVYMTHCCVGLLHQMLTRYSHVNWGVAAAMATQARRPHLRSNSVLYHIFTKETLRRSETVPESSSACKRT